MSHCTHWTSSGEQCCDCGQVFPHDGTEQYTTPCPPESTAVITINLQPIAEAFAEVKAALLTLETQRLRCWKDEALPLLAQLDRCHDLLPAEHQAPLGGSKADAVERYLRNRAVRTDR